MANNYCTMAEEFKFPEAAAKDFELIASAVQDEMPEKLPEWLDAEQREYFEDCGGFSLDVFYGNGKLRLVEEESADLDVTAEILSAVMKRHDVRDVVCLHAAYTSSKPRPGEFGGATCAVGPGIVKFLDERELVDSVRREMEAANKGMKPQA